MCRWCDFSGENCQVREAGEGVRTGNFLLYVSAIQAGRKCSSASKLVKTYFKAGGIRTFYPRSQSLFPAFEVGEPGNETAYIIILQY